MKIIVLLMLFLNLQILSQDSSNNFSFNISLGGGFASEAAFAVYNLEERNTDILDYSPGLSGKFGIAYESITKIYGLNIGLALDVGYFTSSTPTSNFNPSGKAEQRIIPITLSLLLDNYETLNPILKLGLGLGNKKYIEEYENFSQANVSAENWFFILIGGTGLKYKISSSFDVALILEAVILDGKVSNENSLGYRSGIKGIQSNTYLGLQFGYSINI